MIVSAYPCFKWGLRVGDASCPFLESLGSVRLCLYRFCLYWSKSPIIIYIWHWVPGIQKPQNKWINILKTSYVAQQCGKTMHCWVKYLHEIISFLEGARIFLRIQGRFLQWVGFKAPTVSLCSMSASTSPLQNWFRRRAFFFFDGSRLGKSSRWLCFTVPLLKPPFHIIY